MGHSHSHSHSHSHERSKEAIKVTILSTIINVLLMVSKFIAGILGKSTALIADGVHSLSDLVTDTIVIIASKISQKPVDDKHPFGHSKIETISSFILGFILVSVGLNIAWESVWTVIDWFRGDKVEISKGIFYWVVIIGSILAKEILFQITIRVAKKYKNDSLKANAWHHRSDSLSSVAVLIGYIIVSFTGFAIADSIAAILVSVLIIKIGVEVAYNSGNTLLDVSAGSEMLRNINTIVTSTKGVVDTHALKSRKVGDGVMLHVNIVVDRKISVDSGHRIAEDVRNNIMNKLDEVKDVIVHVDPHKTNTEVLSEPIINTEESEAVLGKIKSIENNLSQKVKVKECILRTTDHDKKLVNITIEMEGYTPVYESYKIAKIFKNSLKETFHDIKDVIIECEPLTSLL